MPGRFAFYCYRSACHGAGRHIILIVDCYEYLAAQLLAAVEHQIITPGITVPVVRTATEHSFDQGYRHVLR